MMARTSWLDAFIVALLAASGPSTVNADVARTFPASVLNWELASQMQLTVTSDGSLVPLMYTVIPLTTDLGLNSSRTERGKIALEGRLALADASTYVSISGADAIPYLCCDGVDNSFIDANGILNALMSNDPQPRAILLYSRQNQCCGLTGDNLNFRRILTMADTNDAFDLSNFTTSAAGTARASISGNFSSMGQDQGADQTGKHSAVAMSILYSITGLITLLFMVIIATGAIRAHRYPERYGPRSGFGGRPRQSRAKGLARAVLETIPIVKFGASQPAKPDPNVELDNHSHEPPVTPQNGSERHLSTIAEGHVEPTSNAAVTGTLTCSNEGSAQSVGEGPSGVNSADGGAGNDEGLGCSICTEDFTVGEDVRVLPCNHKFHPPCVDPWLVNVSGTCPLCRLDLRPENEDIKAADEVDFGSPPLGAEGNEAAGDHASTTRRRSRLFELARLRHASVEERLEALRRIRTEQGAGATGSSEEENQHRAKLSKRLRDKFHVKTGAAQPTPEVALAGSSTMSADGAGQSRT